MLDRRSLIRSAACAAAAAAMPGRVLGAGDTQPVWQNLFDGRSLDGWSLFQLGSGEHDRYDAVMVEQGMLHFLGPKFHGPDEAAMGHIATLQPWSNYHLRVDYRWGERRIAPRGLQRRNSGILYHLAPDRDILFPDGIEFQVEETDVGDAITINNRALAGPLLGGTPLWPGWIPGMPRTYEAPLSAGGIARQWFRHAGQFERLEGWNTLDLIAFDDCAAHLVNGRIVQTLFGMVGRTRADGTSPPLTGGRIALEFEAAEIWFRNVNIRPLKGAALAAIKSGQPL